MEVRQWSYEEFPEFTERVEGAGVIETTGDEQALIRRARSAKVRESVPYVYEEPPLRRSRAAAQASSSKSSALSGKARSCRWLTESDTADRSAESSIASP